MRRIRSVGAFLATALIYFSFSLPAFAATSSLCPTGQFSSLCNLSLNSSTGVVGRVITILLILAVILCLFFLVWGGIRWITSGGDKGKVEGARGAITAALIGLVVAFLSYFFLNVVVFLFTKNTISNFNIPTIVP